MSTRQSSSSTTRTTADRREAVIERVREFYQPGRRDPVITSRKERFDALNRLVQGRGGWIVSIPGGAEVTLECLPGSSLIGELRERGLDPKPASPPTGERILATTITEKFARATDGKLVALTEGSTRAVAEVRRHAGIVRVLRYSFLLRYPESGEAAPRSALPDGSGG
jgi:hypothetical protein